MRATGEEALRERLRVALSDAIGEEEIRTDPESLAWAAEDAAGSAGVGRAETDPVFPLLVALPRSTKAVQAVLRVAAQERVRVVPRGCGTGVMGGARVTETSLVLDLSELSDIVLRLADGVVEVGAGAVLGEINRRLAPHGYVLGHDPWSVGIASAGGAFSTDGVGYMAGRWGSMRDQVAGVEAVLADGSIVRSRPFKPAFGPSLVDLFAGSQGTLGVVSRLWLYVRPLGPADSFETFRFAGFDSGYRALRALWDTGIRYDLLDMSDDEPVALGLPEGMEDAAGRTAILHLGAVGEIEDVGARLAVARRVLDGRGATLGEKLSREYWQNRHHWAEVYERTVQQPHDRLRRRQSRDAPLLDYLNLMLWPSEIPGFRRYALNRVAQAEGLRVGEAGIWCRPELFSLVVTAEDASQGAELDRVLEELASHAQDLGGTCESIHGTGLRWARLMAREAEPGAPAFHRIQAALDPEGRLNPGKFPVPGSGG